MENKLSIDRAKLQTEYKELMFKLALIKYAERQSAAIEQETAQYDDVGKIDIEKVIDKGFRLKRRQEMARKAVEATGKVITKAAVVFLVFAMTFTTAFAVSDEVRGAVYRIIFSVEDRYTLVQIDSSTAETFINPEIYTWEHCFAPTYLPEGYELYEYVDLGNECYVEYVNKENSIVFSQIKPDVAGSLHLNSEDAEVVKTIVINNSSGIMSIRQGRTTIAWQVGGSLLNVYSNENTEEVIEFAKSIHLMR